MSTASDIVRGIALQLWSFAYSAFTGDPHEEPPSLPAEAMRPAQELANLYTFANDKSLVALLAMTRGVSPLTFGRELAWYAIDNDETNLGRDGIRPVTFQIHYDGNLLEWEGDVGPHLNPPRGIPGGGAGGPTRAGEHSRFRTTLRGVERATAVIPRRHRELKAGAPRPIGGELARISTPPSRKRKR